MKIQAADWEKILGNLVSDKGLASGIYEKTINIQTSEQTIHRKLTMGNCKREMKRHFIEVDIQMTRKHMTECSTLLDVREIKPKRNVFVHQPDFLNKS